MFSLAIERMERNYTFTGDFSPEAVAAVLSIEMIIHVALIANGVVLSDYYLSKEVLETVINNILYFSHTGTPCMN